MALNLDARIVNLVDVVDPHIHDVLCSCAFSVKLAYLISSDDSLVRAYFVPVLLDDGAWYLVIFVGSTDDWACR